MRQKPSMLRAAKTARPEQESSTMLHLRRARWLALPCTALFAAGCADQAPPASTPAGAAAQGPAPMELAQPVEPMPAVAALLQVAEPADMPMAGLMGKDEMADKDAKLAMWAPVREFPAPSYDPAYEGPRTDFRETIFWKPSIQTDTQGRAQVSFFLSDAVTSFRAGVEGIGGGKAGRGDAVIASRLPVSLAAKLPLEVTAGDRVELPVVVTNATLRALDAQVSARTGAAFSVKEAASTRVKIDPQQSKTVYYDLTVKAAGDSPDAGKIALSAEGAKMTDSMERIIRVVAPGFPRDASGAGTLVSGATSTEEIELEGPIAGTLTASIGFFPTPKATLVAAAKSMLSEPNGCFEQTSSTNYPNVMVAGYLKKAADADPETSQKLGGLLERGYQKLAGYESKNKGYEWFGEDPGHEALTAYGLLEFVDMAQVYKGVDQEMVNRTRAWLKSRRDGKGGYQRNSKALDSFGRASQEVTNAYITWALAEAGERDMNAELDHVAELAKSSNDSYILALSAGALAAARPGTDAAKQAITRLASKQSKDGDFPGAAESITQSGGIALSIETTALAAMALQRAGAEQRTAVGRAVKWIEEQRSGSGSFGSTQATVLALRALTRASEGGNVPDGTVNVTVNGRAMSLKLDPKSTDSLTLGGFAQDLKPGKNTITISAPGVKDLSLPYAIKVNYSTRRPASSPKAKVGISVSAPESAKVGQSVKVKVEVANTTGDGLPMVIARIGVPGGLEQQKWQLDELKKKGLVDFYETREREVIVYYRSMAPQSKKRFDLDLLASVPGTFTAPASQVYLYYTDEHRRFVDPVKMTIHR
jgi:alpha-2-macroglobulin-like protein